MAFSQSQSNYMVNKRISGGSFQCAGRTTVEGENIAGVVAFDYYPKITSREEVDGVINFNGALITNISYVTIDGNVNKTQISVEFNNSCSAYGLSDAWVMPEVTNIDVTLVDNSMCVSAQVGVTLYGVISETITQINEDEDVVTNSEQKEIKSLASAASEEFNIVEEIKVNRVIEEIVSSPVVVTINAVNSLADKVVLEGTVLYNLMMKSGDEIASEIREVPLRQEVACLGANENDEAIVMGYVSGVETTILPTQDAENETVISVGVTYNANVYTTKSEMVNIVSDAFSVREETTPVSEAANLDYISAVTQTSKLVSGEIDITTYPEFDQIVSVNANAVAVALNEANSIDMVIETQVVTRDESGQISVRTEHVPVVFGESHGEVSGISALVSGYHVRQGRDLEVEYTVSITTVSENKQVITFVSNLDQGAGDVSDDAGIKMYYVREGERLFDVCRELRVRPEVVLSQNEGAENVSAGDKIIVYFPQSVNF